ncbi:MAG: DNA repair protein RecO [Qingshengfaniella sp.]
MEWRAEGLLLSVRPHGENAAIIETFTRDHGRHAGVVRGGTGRRLSPVLQPGAQLDLRWRARLADHIGAFTVEPLRSRAALIEGRLTLAGLTTICALLVRALPERDAAPVLYDGTLALLDLMVVTEAWPLAYLRWEMALLTQLGAGLDLSACAVTGVSEGLELISPRTGRAVTRAGAGAFADRLLPLPPAMLGRGAAPAAEVALALGTTGHFLARALPTRIGQQELPASRARLITMLERQSPG